MPGKELEPYLNEEIRGVYADIILNEPDRLASFLASSHDYTTLYRGTGNGLHAPLTSAGIDYLQESSGDVQLHGLFEFNVDNGDEYDSNGWQGHMAELLWKRFFDRSIACYRLPYQKDDFFFSLTDSRSVLVEFGANLTGCDIGLSLVRTEELYHASGGDVGTSPDEELPVPVEDAYGLLHDFVQGWSLVQDSIIAEFTQESVHSQPRMKVAISAPIPDREVRETNMDFDGTTLLESIGYQPLIEMTTRPHNPFDEIGGAFTAKRELEKIATIFSHSSIADMYDVSVPNIILQGPEGTGKSSLAKAFAARVDAQFHEFDSTNVIDMWVGNSGKNVKRLFQAALEAADDELVVILFEEFETVAMKGTGGTSERVDAKKQLNLQLDKLAKRHNVMLIATTNADRDDLDASLVRSKRFKFIPVGKPNEVERADIWSQILLAQAGMPLHVPDTYEAAEATPHGFRLYDDTVNPLELAKLLEDITGADIESILDDARMSAFQRHLESGERQTISQTDIIKAIRNFGR